ncbi:MAG: mannose-1-phosphate guanylyltransferase [Phycisphaerales bacterium]|nr:MAG: mannose-1-phosphate guanylyltransferase [Phycisphaerales bacterium]
MRYGVIMAGGAGVRLWPLSRRNRPKQLLRLFDGKSLLRQSFERIAALLDPKQIYIITNAAHLAMIADDLPELPAENLIGEPVGRDTAAAVALPAAVLQRKDPEAVIGVFTADHIITPIEKFTGAVDRAFAMAEERAHALVTMGITPTGPDTNFGYVQRGERVSDGVFRVEKFAEKPDVDTAKNYVSSGQYYWNSGMFAWRASAILSELEKNLPQCYGPICEIADAWDTGKRDQKLTSIYPELTKISIDYAVMEHAKHVLVVEMACDWIDVGSWPAMASVIQADADGNVSTCPRVTHRDSRTSIVVSEDDHLIATMGVDDLVVVRSPDATLVCRRDRTDDLKALVEEVRQKYGEQYL